MIGKIASTSFYREYHGHPIADLATLLQCLRKDHSRTVFLAGDSSLDNKAWFEDVADAVNGYEKILTPPTSKKDIAYWMNLGFQKRNLSNFAVINCAIEESTIEARAGNRLLPQDQFIHDNIASDDVLVVSVGGNDVALSPTPATARNVASLLSCTNVNCLRTFNCECAVPCEDYRLCGCLSKVSACSCGMEYMVHMFSVRIQDIVSRIVAKNKPKLILVCMLYFLDEKPGNSWAEGVLRAMGYNSDPEKLQAIIRQLFFLATKTIKIPGSVVIAVPLFEALDGKDTTDYSQRVEPSAKGGEKMGEYLVEKIVGSQDVRAEMAVEDAHTAER
jgi:hypothetical protein